MFKHLNNFENIVIIRTKTFSKKIKKKNIKIYYGKPILQLSYEIIKNYKIFDKIILYSDNKEFRGLKENIDFNILIKRPKELSDDYT
jgi:pseudaminic acid cytidylyltransferase